MRRLSKFIITFALFCPAMFAQKGTPLSDAELAKISARGRMIAEYDTASWHATDAVLALKPPEGAASRYIARKTAAGWVVVFGRYRESKDAFLIVYEATQGEKPDQFTVKTYDPPEKETGFFYAAANGIETALRNTKLQDRPYNTYVLPLDSGQMYVYILPAQTVANIYPLGGDVRYLISASGTEIVETRVLHKSIQEVANPGADGKTPEAHFHTHVVSDVPEDSDVFHVLRQNPPVPEYIVTNKGLCVVQKDGTITPKR